MLIEEIDLFTSGARRLSTLAPHLESGLRELQSCHLDRFDEVNSAANDLEVYNALRLAEHEDDVSYSDFIQDIRATEPAHAILDIEHALRVVRHFAAVWARA